MKIAGIILLTIYGVIVVLSLLVRSGASALYGKSESMPWKDIIMKSFLWPGYFCKWLRSLIKEDTEGKL